MKFKTQIATGYLVILVLMVILAGVTFWSNQALVDSEEWITHTHEVIGAANLLDKLAVDMETGVRGYVITGKDEFLEPYTLSVTRYETTIAELRKLISDNPDQLKRLDLIEGQLQQWDKEAAAPEIAARRMASNVANDANAMEAVVTLVESGVGKNTMDSFRREIEGFVEAEYALLKTRKEQSEDVHDKTIHVALFGTLGAIVLGLLSMGLSIRTVMRQVGGEPAVIATIVEQVARGDLDVNFGAKRDAATGILASVREMVDSLGDMAQTAQKIAGGDLTAEVTPQSSKDILGNALKNMVTTLRKQIRAVAQGAETIAASANEMVTLSAQLAASTSETATAASQTATTVEEVRQVATNTSEKAQQISTDFALTVQVGEAGLQAAEDTVHGMELIREQMESIAESIVQLSEQSLTVGGIISAVDDIAEQSNMLAVNAAVEAARAGDEGRGFAVVAGEIKSLAEQSKQATAQVRTILNDIQKATSNAVMATEKGSKVVDAGTAQAASAGDAIRQLSDSISQSAGTAIQIAAASRQQVAGMEQINAATESIKQAGEQNLGGTKQLEQAARNLQDLGVKLQQLVQAYRT